MLEGDVRILFSQNMDIMLVHFTIDVGSAHIIKDEPCGQVLVVFNHGLVLAAEFVLYGQIFWSQGLDQLKFVQFHSINAYA
jgi:hypothetical protein